MRELYRKVHPDLFHAHPVAREANEGSVKLLHAYLDAMDAPPGASARGPQVYSFEFYVRPADDSPEAQEPEDLNSLRRVKMSLPAPGTSAGGGFGGTSGAASGVLSFLGGANEGLSYVDEQAGIERLFRACGVDVAVNPAGKGRGRRAPRADASSPGVDALRAFVRQNAGEGARRSAENARLEVEEANLRAALRMNRSLRVVYRGLPPFKGGAGATDGALRAPHRHERVLLLHLLVQALEKDEGGRAWAPGRPTTLVFGSDCRLCRVHGHVHLDASRLSLLGGAPTGLSSRTADAIARRWARFLVDKAQPDALDECQGAAVKLKRLESLAARALGCDMIYAASDGIANTEAYREFLGGLAAEAADVLDEDGGDPVAAASREARLAREAEYAELLRRHGAELEERRRQEEEDARPIAHKLWDALQALGGRREWRELQGEKQQEEIVGNDGRKDDGQEAQASPSSRPPRGIPDLVVMVTGGEECSVDATNGVLHLPCNSDPATARNWVSTFGARAAGMRRHSAQEEALTEAAARQAIVALRLKSLARAMPDRDAGREDAARSRPFAQAGYTGAPVDERVFRECCAKLVGAGKQLRHVLQGSAICIGDRFEILPSGVLVLDSTQILTFDANVRHDVPYD